MTTTVQIQTTPISPPQLVQAPPHHTEFSFHGRRFQATVYMIALDGTRTALSTSIDPRILAQVSDLTRTLIQSHEQRSTRANEPPFSIREIRRTGLLKEDNTEIDHNFAVHPIAPAIANQATRYLTHLQPTAITAQNIWDSMEAIIASLPPLHTHATTPPTHTTTPPTHATTPPTHATTPPTHATTPPTHATTPPTHATTPPTHTTTPPTHTTTSQVVREPTSSESITSPQLQNGSTSSPSTNPTLSPFSTHLLPQQPLLRPKLAHHALIHSRGIDFSQPGWYEAIPEKIKLRIINDLLGFRNNSEVPIYQHFSNRFNNNIEDLNRERSRLVASIQLNQSQTGIGHTIKEQAERRILQSYYNNDDLKGLQEEISQFLAQEFDRKEELNRTIHQIAEHSGAPIGRSIDAWAPGNIHSFVRALIIWLDNDGQCVV